MHTCLVSSAEEEGAEEESDSDLLKLSSEALEDEEEGAVAGVFVSFAALFWALHSPSLSLPLKMSAAGFLCLLDHTQVFAGKGADGAGNISVFDLRAGGLGLGRYAATVEVPAVS